MQSIQYTLTHCATAHQGEEYWRAERDICRRLARSASGPAEHAESSVSIEELHTASESKSFDYRVSSSAVAMPDAC